MACPLCDGVADSFGDHARTCPCGGGRVKRHNCLRAVLAGRAQSAGLSPEVEKPGLLPPRLDAVGAPEDGVRAGGGRRPADVWVASWGAHGPAAFDLAVTSGMRPGHLVAPADPGGGPAADYEARKRRHLDTQDLCTAQWLQFIPLVAEACGGGWGPTAVKTWRALAHVLCAHSGEPSSVEMERLLQTFSITLQRENARAGVTGRRPRQLSTIPERALFHATLLPADSWPLRFFPPGFFSSFPVACRAVRPEFDLYSLAC